MICANISAFRQIGDRRIHFKTKVILILCVFSCSDVRSKWRLLYSLLHPITKATQSLNRRHRVTVQSAESLSAAIPLGTSTKRANSKRANHGLLWFGCGRFLSADDGHDRCLQCLGFQHAEDAFLDDSCTCCGCMSMTLLRSRLSFLKRLAPSAATHADFSGSSRKPPAGALGDLRVTVRASPPGTSPRTSYSSCSERPVRFPGDFAGPSHGASFGAPSEDRMSTAASGWAYVLWGWRCGGATPSGVVTTAAPDPKLTSMLTRAAMSIGLEVNRPPSSKPSRLDDWLLGAGHGSQPRSAPVPFSRRCMRSWRSRGWPLSRPEAACPSPPSSLLSMAGLPGGTRALSRWRERSRCTCAHETPPLGGTVCVSRPKPASWRPLSQSL